MRTRKLRIGNKRSARARNRSRQIDYYSDFIHFVRLEIKIYIIYGLFVNFRIWNAEFGFKEFCLIYIRKERSDTANPKSKV